MMRIAKFLQLVTLVVPLIYSANATSLEITHVYHEPKSFTPKKQQDTKIYFTLSGKAEVKIKFYDDRDFLISQIVKQLSKGAHYITWKGTDIEGRHVPAEAYHYTIMATDSAGTSIEYDTTDISGNSQLKVKNIVWDKDKKSIRYQLPKAARIIIRIGILNRGPLMRSLNNWSPRTAGFHDELWDGMDASKVVNLSSHPKLDISIDAYSLSSNSIIVNSDEPSVRYVNTTDWGENKRNPKFTHKKKMFSHSQQSPETRGDLTVKLVLANQSNTIAESNNIVSGIVPIRLEVASEDKNRLLERGFEPIFFLDGIYMHENEMGFLPVTWNWDTRNISDGEHFITGNIRSYEGNFGSASIKVFVKNNKAGGV